MVLVLPALADILFWVGALIFCYLVVYIAKALFGIGGTILGQIPVIGGWIEGSLHHIEQRIVSTMSHAALAVDKRIASGFHMLARLVDWVGREINSHANLLYVLSSLFFGSTVTQAIAAALRLLHLRVQALPGTATALFHTLVRPIQGELHTLERWVYPRVKALDHAIDVTIPKDIAGLKARATKLENEYSKLYEWMRTHPWTLVTDAFVGAVAIALSRLGLDWIKCNNARGLFNRRGCNVWSDIETLLIGAAALELPYTLELLAVVGREVIKDGTDLIKEFK